MIHPPSAESIEKPCIFSAKTPLDILDKQKLGIFQSSNTAHFLHTFHHFHNQQSLGHRAFVVGLVGMGEGFNFLGFACFFFWDLLLLAPNGFGIGAGAWILILVFLGFFHV